MGNLQGTEKDTNVGDPYYSTTTLYYYYRSGAHTTKYNHLWDNLPIGQRTTTVCVGGKDTHTQ